MTHKNPLPRTDSCGTVESEWSLLREDLLPKIEADVHVCDLPTTEYNPQKPCWQGAGSPQTSDYLVPQFQFEPLYRPHNIVPFSTLHHSAEALHSQVHGALQVPRFSWSNPDTAPFPQSGPSSSPMPSTLRPIRPGILRPGQHVRDNSAANAPTATGTISGCKPLMFEGKDAKGSHDNDRSR